MAALMGFLSPHITFAEIVNIRANADMSYSQSKATSALGETSSSWSLNQNYRLNLSKSLTRTITFRGDVSLSISDSKGGERRERIFPFFTLNFSPPRLARRWYNLNFSYNVTQTVPSEGVNIRSTHTSASLNLPFERWPAISLNYNRSTQQDDLSPHILDSVNNSIGLQTSYGFEFLGTEASTSYSFSGDITESKPVETKSENVNHFVGIGFSRDFWKERISTSANFGFRYTQFTTESLGAPQRFQTGVPANQGVSGIFTGTPFDATDPFFTNNALIDGNINASAGINLDTQSSNIVIGFDTAQELNEINLNITTALTKAIIDTLLFGWQLFTSDDGISWTSFGVQFPVYEEIPSRRFVFSFTERTARFFRLVNTNAPNTGSPIDVSEMEGLGFILATPSQSFTNTQTADFGGFGISFAATKALTIRYNASYSHAHEDLSDRDSTGVTQGVSLGYTVIPRYLSLSASFVTSSSKSTGSVAGVSRSYALSFSSSPLPTLGGGVGLRRSESLSGSDKISRSDSLSASVDIRLYRGVDLTVSSNFSESIQFTDNSTSQSIAFLGDIRLQPWKPFSVVMSGVVSRSEREREGVKSTGTTESLNGNFNLNLSQKFSMSGSYSILPDFSQSYNVSWRPTRNINSSARVGFSEDSINFGADLSWRPLRRLSLNLGYSGTRSEETDAKSDSFFARGSLRF
jgi:hypothetical protein